MPSLEQDYITCPGQVYAVISLVGPDCPQKNDKFGLKIRGAFATRDEAGAHAARLQKDDATFDIYVVDMYKWLLIPPATDKIDDVHYNDTKLEELISGYKSNQNDAKRMFEDRKRDYVEGAASSSSSSHLKAGDENSKFYSRGEEKTVEHPADVLERLKAEQPDATTEELVKLADAEVSRQEKEIQDAREQNRAAAE